MNLIENKLKSSFIFNLWLKWNKRNNESLQKAEQKRIIEDWEKNGKPVPPPQIYKRLEIKKYATDNKIRTFVETGTYLGETVDYFKNYFYKVISIELDQKLYTSAKEKFAGYKQIEILQGDSGEVLKKLVSTLSEP